MESHASNQNSEGWHPLSTLNEKMNTRWYHHPGASDHMANNREHFVDYVPIEAHDTQMGNNLNRYDLHSIFAKLELRNMVCVPRVCKNLMSWLCLYCNGWDMSHPEE